MVTSEKPADTHLVSCEVCLKEVPVGEAKVADAADCFAHFCGLDCHEKWRNQGGFSSTPGDKLAKP